MGYDTHEVIGTPSIHYLTEQSRIQAGSLLQELLSKGMITNVDVQAVTKSGVIIDILAGTRVKLSVLPGLPMVLFGTHSDAGR